MFGEEDGEFPTMMDSYICKRCGAHVAGAGHICNDLIIPTNNNSQDVIHLLKNLTDKVDNISETLNLAVATERNDMKERLAKHNAELVKHAKFIEDLKLGMMIALTIVTLVTVTYLAGWWNL